MSETALLSEEAHEQKVIRDILSFERTCPSKSLQTATKKPTTIILLGMSQVFQTVFGIPFKMTIVLFFGSSFVTVFM